MIDIVYNGGTGTVIILDNRTTGMTGHQENPSTGKTLLGDPSPELNFEALCLACGVKRVVTVDPIEKDNLERALAEETAAEEPSVIIVKRKCILKK